MNKKTKALAALALALCMAFSLAACGKTKQQEETKIPEYVYASSFQPLSNNANGYLSIQAYTDEGAYATCYEKSGRVIPDGVDVAGKTEDELSRYDVYVTNLYFIDNNGTVKKLDNYEPMPAKTNDAGYSEFSSSASMNNLAVDKDGNLAAIESVYCGYYDGPEGKTWADDDYYSYYHYTQEYFLRRLAPDGSEISTATLALEENQYVYSKVLFDDAGNLLAASDNILLAFSPDGAQAYTIPSENYIQSLITLADGKNYAVVYGNEGCELCPIDSATQSLGAAVALPRNAYDPIAGGGNYDIYYTDGLYFCGYDIETATSERLFNWINCDVNNYDINNVQVLYDGTVTGVINDYDSTEETYTSSNVRISKVASDTLPKKEKLTLACMWLDYNVRDMVIKFNRSSDSVRITVKDYSEFNTEDDYEIGSKKFLTEMMAGGGADIISLSGLPYRQMAAKGLLADIYPYIDSDTEFKRGDFFPNVLKALEVDGKLYNVSPSFYVSTVMGATSVVGEGTSWTYDELDAALANMPEGCEIFDQYSTRDDILQTCLTTDLQYYVDWATGKCNFDSAEFKALLNFANRFPESYENNDEYSYEDSAEARIKSGRQMLLRTSIYGVDDTYYNTSFFNGGVNYIGYPTLTGCGNALNVDTGYAMSSTCADKDAAWQFLRTFYTENYQKSNVWSIPTNISVYNAKIKEAMKVEYLTDEKGEYILDENGEKAMQPRYSVGSDDGSTVNVYAMTQEQADQLWAVVSGIDKLYDYDESIMSIVKEQSKPFFAGQKSVDEVAKLIQSKAQIYVSEQG